MIFNLQDTIYWVPLSLCTMVDEYAILSAPVVTIIFVYVKKSP